MSSECATADADLLPHVGTPDTARDMEAIRIALDEAVGRASSASPTAPPSASSTPRCSPTGCERWCSTASSIRPQTFTEWQFGQISGFDAAFEAQAAGCRAAGRSECGVADLAAAYDEVARHRSRTLRSVPVRTRWVRQSSRPLRSTPPTGPTGGRTSARRWPTRRRATALDSASWPTHYYDLGGYTAYAAIECLDAPTPEGEAAFTAFVDQARAQSPRFGGSVANELRPCATWPVRPADGRQSLGPLTAPGAPTIVVVGNTGDPATPLANAEAVAARLGSGHLVRVDVDGHTAYGSDDCVTATVDEYLIDPTKPVTTTDCN